MIVVLLIVGLALAVAQEDHSRHEHPVAGLGTVNFPTSCNASAQKRISRGVALLHSFGYEEARLAFNEAAKADPSCGMAYFVQALFASLPQVYRSRVAALDFASRMVMYAICVTIQSK